MHSLVTVVSVLRWVIAMLFALCILHPAKADITQATKAIDCGSSYITTYCYPPTGHDLK